MCKDNLNNINPFFFVQEETCSQNETREKSSVKPPGGQSPEEEFFALSVEQVLVMLAIEAAPSRWLFRRARENALAKAMAAAELFIYSFAHPGTPETKRELTAYRRFLQRILRLGTDNTK